ncbi:E3 ubiquitin-protein ligase TRIM38-like [Peromyscus leucopus]|uniref:E3 ubiquitin-protein ligase TRIM38-like n=1 Tax=Peromyscus leucopus TaxID=10041 RepID=UPI001884A92D|nr:E3 ubiquitin-protein ligase TRIM38-like [Peromyscus leucopus]
MDTVGPSLQGGTTFMTNGLPHHFKGPSSLAQASPLTCVLGFLRSCHLRSRSRVSVTLDPSTAHRDLTLSKDRRQVTYKRCHENLEASAERFDVLPCVLGCEDFTSGRYYFEVSVENATTWDVGVCVKDVPRGFDRKKEPEFGFWTIRMCKKDGLGALTSTPTSLHLSEKPQLVGVFLDYEAGLVFFYNVTFGSHIFTFPKASFQDTLMLKKKEVLDEREV